MQQELTFAPARHVWLHSGAAIMEPRRRPLPFPLALPPPPD